MPCHPPRPAPQPPVSTRPVSMRPVSMRPALSASRRHVLAAAASGLALPFLSRPAAAAVTWTLFTQNVDQSSIAVRGLRRMANQVRERTNSGMLIVVRTAGRLPIDANDVLASVANGRVEMGDDGGYANTIPPAAVMRLPMLLTSPDEFNAASGVLRPYLAAELERRGMMLLGHYRSAMQLFWSRLKAASFADIERQKLRVLSVEQGEFVRHYMGLHKMMSGLEVADALKDGTVDGTFGSAAAAGVRWASFLKHVYLAGPNYSDSIIVAARPAMLQLPDTMVAIVRAAAEDASAWIARAQDGEDQQILRTLSASGLKVTPANPAEVQAGVQKLASYWDSWVRLRGTETENLLAGIRQRLDR